MESYRSYLSIGNAQTSFQKSFKPSGFDSSKEILFRDRVVSSFVIYMFFVCDLCVFLFVCLLLYLWLFAQHVSSHVGREQSLGWNNWSKAPTNYLQVFVINYIIQLISVQTTRIALFICPCDLTEFFWQNISEKIIKDQTFPDCE